MPTGDFPQPQPRPHDPFGRPVFTGAMAFINCPKCRSVHIQGWGCAAFVEPAPAYQPRQMPADGQFTIPYVPPVMGCICPPGANKDCENPTCPRRGPK
jgi:hypothetical protein